MYRYGYYIYYTNQFKDATIFKKSGMFKIFTSLFISIFKYPKDSVC